MNGPFLSLESPVSPSGGWGAYEIFRSNSDCYEPMALVKPINQIAEAYALLAH